jgi:phage tail protein X
MAPLPQTRANQGDTVDLIAHRHYGDTAMVTAILDANPGLSALGPVLPLGTPVSLPPKHTPVATAITLW